MQYLIDVDDDIAETDLSTLPSHGPRTAFSLFDSSIGVSVSSRTSLSLRAEGLISSFHDDARTAADGALFESVAPLVFTGPPVDRQRPQVRVSHRRCRTQCINHLWRKGAIVILSAAAISST